MKKYLSNNSDFTSLLILCCALLCFSFSRVQPSDTQASNPPVLAALHTLSIHVQDTLTHDSVFRFLSEKLKLPVYYHPLMLGERKYAGVYAGNLVLEPCGPYTNFKYASAQFRSLFFGFTFEPSVSISLAAQQLSQKAIGHQVMSDEYIYFNDSSLCGQNTTLSLMNKHEKQADKVKMDSLQSVLILETNPMGIEYVKEIRVGYTSNIQFQKWQQLFEPLLIQNQQIQLPNHGLMLQFVKSQIKEVPGIVFKVKSLAKAKQYLESNGLATKILNRTIELNRAQTVGLSIYLTE